jgi:hypothetical protein
MEHRGESERRHDQKTIQRHPQGGESAFPVMSSEYVTGQ